MATQQIPVSKLYFSFEGRVNRRVFWLNLVVFVALPLMILGALIDRNLGYFGRRGPASLVAMLLLTWPSLAVQAKRWHDLDKSAWWILVGFIPIIGAIWTLVANGFLRGTQGPNRFGDDPLAT